MWCTSGVLIYHWRFVYQAQPLVDYKLPCCLPEETDQVFLVLIPRIDRSSWLLPLVRLFIYNMRLRSKALNTLLIPISENASPQSPDFKFYILQ